MKSKLVYSTRTSGNGEIARSNKRFNKKVKTGLLPNKADIAAKKLDNLLGYNTEIN